MIKLKWARRGTNVVYTYWLKGQESLDSFKKKHRNVKILEEKHGVSYPVRKRR